MEKNQLTDKELNKKIDNIIDNVIRMGKENSKSLLDLTIEIAAQSIDNIVIKNVDLLKQKIKERLSTNEKSKT